MPKFDYKTEVLTSMVGRDKLRVEDLHRKLSNTARTVGSLSPWPSMQISEGCETVTCLSSSASANLEVPHFQLVTTDGTVLGTRELGRPDWPPGSVIYTGPDEPNLRVVDVLDTENEDQEMHFTALVVEPVTS